MNLSHTDESSLSYIEGTRKKVGSSSCFQNSSLGSLDAPVG